MIGAERHARTRVYPRPQFRIFAWLCMLAFATTLFVIALGAHRIQSGATVPQGGSATFPATGTLAPAGQATWDIIDSTSTLIASSITPNNWTVTYTGSNFTVGAPATATVATGYTVRYVGSPVLPDPMNHHSLASKPEWSLRSQVVIGGGHCAVFAVVTGAGSPPAAPTGLTAVAGDQLVNLSWNGSTGATSYAVYKSTTNGSSYTLVSSSVTATNFSVTGLTNGTTYYFVVTASNASGTSPYSNQASATPQAPTPPNAPTNLAASPGNQSVSLTWNASTGAASYSVYRSLATGTGYALVTSSVTNTNYQDTGLTNGTTYFYVVKAVNSVGVSPYSNEASATPAIPPPPPPSTLGTDFWFGVPASGPPVNSSPPHTITLYLTAPGAASGMVSIAGLSFSQTFTIPATGGFTSVTLPQYVQMDSIDGIEENGVHVVSDNPVDVHLFNYDTFATDSFHPYPTAQLGTQHIALCYPGGGFQMCAEFAVVATQNGTILTVTPSVTSNNRSGGMPYTVNLNAGETYQLQATVQSSDLTGSTVISNHPVAFYSGAEGANVPAAIAAANPLIEQVPSVDRWGTQFITVPFATRSNGDRFRFLAARKATVVSINGTTVATLDPGQFYETTLSAASFVSATKPILVAQLSQGANNDGNSNSDPFMTLVPATTQYAATVFFTSPSGTGIPAHYLNLVVPTAAVGTVTRDGVAITSSLFTPITNTAYSWAQVSVSAAAHIVTTSGGLAKIGAIGYGYGNYDGYGTPATFALGVNPDWTWTGPPPPTSLTAGATSSSTINLSWANDPPSINGITIERQTGTGAWAAVANVSPTATTYTDTGLTKATAYNYRVRTFTDLIGDPSNVATATTFDTPPNAPAGLMATPLSQTQMTLSWADTSNNETGFKIERKTGTTGTWAQIGTSAANVSTYQDSGLTKKTLYVYRVRATNTFGDSAYSSEAQGTTKDDPPAAPSALTATAPAWNQVSLSWTDNSNNETGFKIERSVSGGSYVQIATVGANVTTYSDVTVTGATTYAYRVKAYNDGGDSAYSNIATVTTPNPPAPAAPTNLIATAINSAKIDLTWIDNSPVESGFTLQRSPNGGTTWSTIATPGANVTSYSDTGVSASTTYSYRVCAYNVTGSSAWSNVASATTPQGPTATVLLLNVAGVSTSKIALYWNGVVGASGYNLYRGMSASGPFVRLNPTPIAPVDPGPGLSNAYMYVDTGLMSGTYYYYYVAPVIGGSEGTSSGIEYACPGPNAIPYDTGNPTLITNAARNNAMSSSRYVSGAMDIVQGPNGVTYASAFNGQPAIAYSTSASYDLATNMYTDSDGLVSPTTQDYKALLPSAGSALSEPKGMFGVCEPIPQLSGYNPTTPGTGPFRKVEANTGHWGIWGAVVLPTGSSVSGLTGGKPKAQVTTSDVLSTAYIYSGIDSDSQNVHCDVGFQMANAANWGWKPYALSKGHGGTTPLKVQGYQAIMVVGSPMVTFMVCSSVSSGIADQNGLLIIDGMSGAATFHWTNASLSGPQPPAYEYTVFCGGVHANNLNQCKLKRVNSIAQRLKSPVVGGGWTGDGAIPNGPGGGLYMDGAKVIGSSWGDPFVGVTLDGGEMDDTMTYKQGSYPGKPYCSWTVQNEYFWETNIIVQTSP